MDVLCPYCECSAHGQDEEHVLPSKPKDSPPQELPLVVCLCSGNWKESLSDAPRVE